VPGSIFGKLGNLASVLSGMSPTLNMLFQLGSTALGDFINPKPKKHKRRGGPVGRYNDGGLVPILAAGDEMLVHGGRAAMIPGDPTSDSTLLFAPPGAAVVTGHGQAMMAMGASLQQALDYQLPHFAAGGSVRGRVSTFGPPTEAAGRTASGVSSANPGIALYDTKKPGGRGPTLGHLFDVTIGGHKATLRQIDVGPAPSTGRVIDVTGAGARKLGIDPRHFPTDSIGTAKVRGTDLSGQSVSGPSVNALSSLSARQARLALPRLLEPLAW
jgi:hypothetical protein